MEILCQEEIVGIFLDKCFAIMETLWTGEKEKLMNEMNEIKELAEKVGRHPTTVFRWIKQTRQVGLRDAILLEKETGIPRLAWLYPEEYRNPMIEKYKKVS